MGALLVTVLCLGRTTNLFSLELDHRVFGFHAALWDGICFCSGTALALA